MRIKQVTAISACTFVIFLCAGFLLQKENAAEAPSSVAPGAAPPSAAAGTSSSPSWPQFHGPGGTNRSPDTGLLKKWPEDGPPKLWTYSKCGRGYSGVAIAEGKVFTAGDIGREEVIIALSMNGKLLWQAANGSAWRGASPGSRATPTYSEGVLYHMNPEGRLAAFTASNGKELWSADLKERFDAQYGIWAYAENLIVDGGKIICMPGGPKGRVVAIDKKTGKTVWANTGIKHPAAYCSGIIVTHGGRRQFLSMTQRSVVSVDVATGALLWSAPFVPRSPQNALTPVYLDGYVFVACGHSSGGRLLKIDQESKSAETIWHRRDLDDCHSGAMVIDGRLYGCACRVGARHFYCVDFFTGTTIKTDKSLGKVGLTYADGKLYAINHQGTMCLIDVPEDGFEVVSSFTVTKERPNSFLAHPVVFGGRLYIRCNKHLHVYKISAK